MTTQHTALMASLALAIKCAGMIVDFTSPIEMEIETTQYIAPSLPGEFEEREVEEEENEALKPRKEEEE
jgi:cell shape-determining protein MreC